jgi:hypothetical protein
MERRECVACCDAGPALAEPCKRPEPRCAFPRGIGRQLYRTRECMTDEPREGAEVCDQ